MAAAASPASTRARRGILALGLCGLLLLAAGTALWLFRYMPAYPRPQLPAIPVITAWALMLIGILSCIFSRIWEKRRMKP